MRYFLPCQKIQNLKSVASHQQTKTMWGQKPVVLELLPRLVVGSDLVAPTSSSWCPCHNCHSRPLGFQLPRGAGDLQRDYWQHGLVHRSLDKKVLYLPHRK